MKRIICSSVLALSLVLALPSFAQLNFSDGSTQTTAAAEQNNLISIVGKGTDTENGTALRDALAAITDATSTNQYTILLASSIYDVGTSALVMKSNVHIQGVNRKSSRITGSGSLTIAGADGASLFNLRVTSSANGSTLYSISNAFSEHFDVDFAIPEATGDLTGLSITGAGFVNLSDCRVGAFGDLNNGSGSTIGIFVSGTDSEIQMFGCVAGMTEINPSGDITCILIENSAKGWISGCDIDVEPNNGSIGACVKITSNADVTIVGSVFDAANSEKALITSGTVIVTAANSLFTGTVTTAYNNGASDRLTYSQCSNNFSDL